jgi:hypothetical protein
LVHKWKVQASTTLLDWLGEESGFFEITGSSAEEIRARPSAGAARQFLRLAFRPTEPD